MMLRRKEAINQLTAGDRRVLLANKPKGVTGQAPAATTTPITEDGSADQTILTGMFH